MITMMMVSIMVIRTMPKLAFFGCRGASGVSTSTAAIKFLVMSFLLNMSPLDVDRTVASCCRAAEDEPGSPKHSTMTSSLIIDTRKGLELYIRQTCRHGFSESCHAQDARVGTVQAALYLVS